MPVHFEARGPVAIVTIDRPEVANAIDRPDRERSSPTRSAASTPTTSLHVAVLTGADGTFCAGADLKAMREPGAPRASRRRAGRRRPDGPDAHAARQAGHRRRRGPRGRGRARARRLVRPARRRRGRRLRRLLPALGHPADRRRHDPAAAPDRPQPRARPDPHRPRRLRRGGAAHGPREPARAAGQGARRGARARARDRLAAAGRPAQRPALVVRAVVAARSRRRCCASTSTACRRCAPASSARGSSATRRAAGAAATSPETRPAPSGAGAVSSKGVREGRQRTVPAVHPPPAGPPLSQGGPARRDDPLAGRARGARERACRNPAGPSV